MYQTCDDQMMSNINRQNLSYLEKVKALEAIPSRPAEIRRMASAFEHDDLSKALRL